MGGLSPSAARSFTPELDLNRVIAYLRRNPQGGDRRRAGDQPPPLAGTPLHHGPPLRLPRRTSAACWHRDRRSPRPPQGPQFFIARTERLRLVQWDENLKRVDHNDFFTRSYGVLLTVYDKQFYRLHAAAEVQHPLPELSARLRRSSPSSPWPHSFGRCERDPTNHCGPRRGRYCSARSPSWCSAGSSSWERGRSTSRSSCSTGGPTSPPWFPANDRCG